MVAIATGGMELGALTGTTIGFRDREFVLDLFELITGVRTMNTRTSDPAVFRTTCPRASRSLSSSQRSRSFGNVL